MRILMLGNSFIYYNDLPAVLAELTGAEVSSHTRGGARLAEQINPETEMGVKTLRALAEEQWDYVVLQEMSNAPATTKDKFLQSAKVLCEKIRENGATPVFYATWAYKKGSDKMNSMEFSYDEMYQLMYDAYHEAAEQNAALIADVGKAFYEKAEEIELYNEDGFHPSVNGTRLAAEVIARTIMGAEQ
ncbi:DUF4886 domain-containing protein [Roseburia hominis]